VNTLSRFKLRRQKFERRNSDLSIS